MAVAQEIKIYAHRGAQNGAPENSLAALDLAAIAGAQYIEFDVQLTQDEQLVIIHDEELQRTAGRAGLVCDLTYAELTQMDIGSFFSPSFSAEKIPGFELWMQRVQDRGLVPNIELKMNSSERISEPEYAQVLATKVAAYLREQWPADAPVRVSSFDVRALQALRAAGYAGEVAFLADKYSAHHIAILNGLQACAYHVNYKYITAKEIKQIIEQGYPVLAYTINELAHARQFLDAGGSGFFTNNVLLMDALS